MPTIRPLLLASIPHAYMHEGWADGRMDALAMIDGHSPEKGGLQTHREKDKGQQQKKLPRSLFLHTNQPFQKNMETRYGGEEGKIKRSNECFFLLCFSRLSTKSDGTR